MIPGFGYRFAPEAINKTYRKEYVESSLNNGEESEVIKWLERPLSQNTWQAKMKTPEIVSEVRGIYEEWKKEQSYKKETKAKDLLEIIKTREVVFVSKKHGPAFSITYVKPGKKSYFLNLKDGGYFFVDIDEEYPKRLKMIKKIEALDILESDIDLDFRRYVLSEEVCLSFIQSFKEEKWYCEYEQTKEELTKESERENDFER